MNKIIITVMILFLFSSAYSEKAIIATWNIKDIFTLEDVEGRKDSLKAFAKKIKPDILFVQEITSLEILESIRDAMGLDNFYVACSDFVQSDTPRRTSFEVGIISKYAFDQVIEFDPSPDNEEDDPLESSMPPLIKLGIEKVQGSRGYLWALIPELKLTVAVVHLKSSLGRKGKHDVDNAVKREGVIGTVAKGVLEDASLYSDYTFVVAGDFNVGYSDCFKDDCGNIDRYDDTHALLAEKIVGKLKMKNLVAHISTTTYPGYPGSPIDNIYVYGKHTGKFEKAEAAKKPYGSDHLAVWTEYEVP